MRSLISLLLVACTTTTQPQPTPDGPLAAPHLSVSISMFDFGAVAVGDTSQPLLVTVTNDGDAATGLLEVGLTEGAIDSFALMAGTTCNLSVELAPGSSCSVAISFKPVDVSSRTGHLTVMSCVGDVCDVAFVDLAGRGV